MTETFIVRRSWVWIGGMSLAFCAAMVIFCAALLHFENPPARRAFALTIAAVGAAGCGALALYMLLVSLRGSIRWSESDIRFAGIFGEKTIPFDRIEEARWTLFGLSSLKLTAGPTRATIRFDDLHPDDQRRLMRLCRDRIPAAVQTGWNGALEAQMQSADHWTFFWSVLMWLLALPVVVALAYLPEAWLKSPEATRTGWPSLDWLLTAAVLIGGTFAGLWAGWRLMEWVERR